MADLIIDKMEPTFIGDTLLNASVSFEIKNEPADPNDANAKLRQAAVGKYEQSGERVGEIYRLSSNQFKFVCFQCFEPFVEFSAFTLHIEQHLIEFSSNELKCEIDGIVAEPIAVISNASDVEDGIHQLSDNLYSTTDDDGLFTTSVANDCHADEKKRTKNGKKKCDDERPIPCSQCHKRFRSTLSLKRHVVMAHRAISVFDCPKCDRTFTLRGKLANHLMEDHDKTRTFECYICHHSFQHKLSALRIHLRHHSSKMFFCHMDAELGYKCDLCPKTCRDYRKMSEHIRRVHCVFQKRKPTEGQSCTICKKAFSCKGSLMQHMSCHQPDSRPHTCHVCGWAFNQRSNLTQHLARHAGEKPCKCEVCGRSFTRSYFSEHMRSHSVVRGFPCQQCDKRFNSSQRLKRHMVCHETERRYQCNMCPKNFTRSDKLLQHKRTHTGDFIYICGICKRGFSEKRSLKRHEATQSCGPVENATH